MTATLFGDYVFHIFKNIEIIETDGLQDETFYVDFEDDEQEDIDLELKKRIYEAGANGLSDT